ncbi:MAG: sulfotransferase [Methanobacteriota archaeon]|nr:MAG: sulfotransferase [Euryarchaeota archaeon]
MKDAKDLKVVYLAGLGRSGGTLLGRVLGEIPGVFYAGEVYFLWADGLLEDRLCQCRQPFSKCTFWKDVLSGAFPEIDFISLGKEMFTAQKRIVREKNFFKMLFLFLQGALFRREAQRYYTSTQTLYQHILQTSQAGFLVDSSRHVTNLLGLSQVANMYVIHLVRDVRGVIYSYRKQKYNPASQKYLPNLSWGRVTREWILKNTMVETVCRFKKIPYLRIRYEKFVEDPVGTLEKIAEFLGFLGDVGVVVNGNKVVLHKSHAIGGNPDKFVQGKVALIPDIAWEKALPTYQRILTGVLAGPWLLHYGYFKLGRKRDA